MTEHLRKQPGPPSMRSLFAGVLCDFQRIPGLVESSEWSKVVLQFSANRHTRPKPLRNKQQAVYAFFQGTIWLRIGKTSYSQRFTSQHYGTGRSGSALAKDIWENRKDFSFVGNEEEIHEWIFSNVGRADIVMPAHWPGAVVTLLESYLQHRLRPRFQGRRQSSQSAARMCVSEGVGPNSFPIRACLDLSLGESR